MDDALIVRSREALGKLHPEPHDFSLGKRPGFDLFTQRLAGNQLHREEINAILRAKFINGFDVRMIELGERQRFFAKLFARRFVGEQTGGKNLQRDVAVELFVMSAIDFAHAARADFFDDPVVGNRSPGEWRRIGHWRE